MKCLVARGGRFSSAGGWPTNLDVSSRPLVPKLTTRSALKRSQQTKLTFQTFAIALCHSSGCNADITKIITAISIDSGVIPSGKEVAGIDSADGGVPTLTLDDDVRSGDVVVEVDDEDDDDGFRRS